MYRQDNRKQTIRHRDMTWLKRSSCVCVCVIVFIVAAAVVGIDAVVAAAVAEVVAAALALLLVLPMRILWESLYHGYMVFLQHAYML